MRSTQKRLTGEPESGVGAARALLPIASSTLGRDSSEATLELCDVHDEPPGVRPLRGRTDELARAERVLRRAASSGQSAALFVSGEPGIGKTAFVDAVVANAAQMGFAVGVSKAEQFEIAPMAALLVALRSGRAPLLSRDEFSELAPLYDKQLWLVDRLTGILEERALQTPLLVAIDDVQWADHLSVFALRVMPARLAGSAIVWLLATRPHPVNATHSLAATLSRDVPIATISLGPLSETAVDELALDRRGARPNGRLRELLRGADGWPFLAVELVDGYTREEDASSRARPRAALRSPSSENGELPNRLLDGVRGRLEALAPQTLELVQVGSVLGRSFTAENAAVLLRVSPWTVVLPPLQAAVEAGVLDDRGERIEFRHDLFRQAVYENVPPSKRVDLHRSAAEHLLATSRDPADAAPHVIAYAQVGDHQAVDVLRRAAAAISPIMPATAVELIERAFALLSSHDLGWVETGEDAIAILSEARRGRDAVAIADRLLATAPDGETAARIATSVLRALWDMDYIDEMRARVEAALILDGVSTQTRTELLALRALALSSTDDSVAAVEAAEGALDAARSIGDRDAEADALRALGEAARNDGRNSEAVGHFRALHALVPTTSPADEIISLQLLDRYDSSRELLAQEGVVSKERRDVATPGIGFAQMWHDYSLGLLDEAETDVRTLLQLCADLQDHRYEPEARLMLCRIAQLRGDLPTAQAHLASAAEHPRHNDENRLLIVLLMRAWLAQSENDRTAALAYVRQVMHPVVGVRHRWRLQPAWLVAATRIAVGGGDLELAHEVASLARVLCERNPGVATVAGIAAHAQGLLSSDVADLRRAVELLRTSPRPLVRADAATDLGRAELAAGRREAGVTALDGAWDIFNRLGACGEAHKVQQLLQSAGLRRRRWGTTTIRPLEGWAALTETEQRVARLIANGHTNRSAAAELIQSPNTVATHLRSIFGKLAVNSRSQLTRSVMNHVEQQLSASKPNARTD